MKVKKELKDRVIFILYNLVVVIVFLAISEGVLAYWLKNPVQIPERLLPAFRAYYTEHLRSTIQMEPACAMYDPELFYTLKPGKSNFANLEFDTEINVNSLGIRDDEQSLRNPEVILLGDSYTMGWGIPQDSIFATGLEHRLQKSVLNAGISSYGTVRELKILNRLPRQSLQTLVIQYHESDLMENRAFHEAGDSLVISSEQTLVETSERVRKRTRYFFGKHTALVSKFVLKDLLGRLKEGRATGKEDVRYFLNALHSLPVPDSLNIVVFELSNYARTDNGFIDELQRELVNFELPHKIRSLKVLDVQKELGRGDYFILDNHINVSGHRKVSNLLEVTLREL